jgi:hypothetical protein
MIRTSTYGDLIDDGAAIRRRLSGVDVSVEAVECLVRDLREWQTRCAIAVAVRDPMLVAEYCAGTGPPQRLMGEGWLPTPGWRRELDERLVRCLRALDFVNRLSLGDRPRRPIRGMTGRDHR